MALQMKCVQKTTGQMYAIKTDQPDPTVFFSLMPKYAEMMKT